MKVELHTGEESPDLLYTAQHAASAGGWVPVIGDCVVFEYIEWQVTNRVWYLEPDQEPVLAVWMKKV